jgi:hypothetical protein
LEANEARSAKSLASGAKTLTWMKGTLAYITSPQAMMAKTLTGVQEDEAKT